MSADPLGGRILEEESDLSGIARRSILAAGLATAVAVAGCQGTTKGPGPSGTGSSGGASGGPAEAVRPTFVAYDGPPPDLKGDPATGVPDAFFSYPDPPPSTGRTPLGVADPVEFLVPGGPPAPALAENDRWQRLNADVGAAVTVNAAPTDYAAKFQTAVAGDALSDFTLIVTQTAELPTLLESRFTDLTPYLSGDNVKKYPNLANQPPDSWDIGTVNGKIWGFTNPRIVTGLTLVTRGDILESKGIDMMPKLSDGEAFLDLCRELTDPKAGVFAIGQRPDSWTVPLIVEALGGPNGWRVESDGTWTSTYESEAYTEALRIVTAMWSEGLFHPNSYTDTASPTPWFESGVTALYCQSFAFWLDELGRFDKPIGAAVMPKWDGGGPAAKHLGAPGYSYPVGIKKTTDEKRIEDLLRVADHLASPFGSEEFLHVNYGLRDRQFTFIDGQVARDPDHPASIGGLFYCGANNSRNIYVAGNDEMARVIHQHCQDLIPTGVKNPSQGRYSNAEVTKSATATRKLNDVAGEIVLGRASLTTWESAVAEWKRGAGDAMAREYAEQG